MVTRKRSSLSQTGHTVFAEGDQGKQDKERVSVSFTRGQMKMLKMAAWCCGVSVSDIVTYGSVKESSKIIRQMAIPKLDYEESARFNERLVMQPNPSPVMLAAALEKWRGG